MTSSYYVHPNGLRWEHVSMHVDPSETAEMKLDKPEEVWILDLDKYYRYRAQPGWDNLWFEISYWPIWSNRISRSYLILILPKRMLCVALTRKNPKLQKINFPKHTQVLIIDDNIYIRKPNN